MDGGKQYDISRSSFDEFVDALFNHDVVLGDVTLPPRTMLGFYIRLFERPEFLLTRYTKAQLERGFWTAMSGPIDYSARDVIWEETVPFEERAGCVRAMYHLYERFFLNEPLDTSSFMWWDALAYDWHCGNRSRANGGDDERMQDVMFETLERILDLPSETCQRAALHGLGHLHHPKTPETIERYLARSIPPELRNYALAASRFEVL